MWGKLRVNLVRWRKFIRVRGRRFWLRINGRQLTWRAYYETDTRKVVAVGSIWPWLTPVGLSYVAFEQEPSKRQVLRAVGAPGHEMKQAVAIGKDHRGAWVETYTRKEI